MQREKEGEVVRSVDRYQEKDVKNALKDLENIQE